MKISEVTVKNLIEYAHEDVESQDAIKDFNIILPACKAYIKGYTGLNDTAIDTYEDLTIALMVLANEMYENRIYTVQNDKVNKVVQHILDMHSINLL